jgi:hypothetical protein
MARTPRYQQRTSAPQPAQVSRNVAEPNQSPRAAIENLGNEFAGQIGRVQQQREIRKREAAEAETRKEMQRALTDGISAESEWQGYLDKSVKTAKPDGTGLVDDFDKKFGEYLPKAMAGYKTEEGRARAEVVYQRVRLQTRDDLAKAQAGLLANDSDRRRREALGNAERIVNLDPSRYGALEATTAALARELPGVSTESRQAFEVEQRGRLALAAGYGAVSQNPYSTLKELSKEKPSAPWAQHLELGDVMRLRSAAQSEVNRREADARSARVEAQSILRADLADAFAARAFGAPAQLPSRSRFVSAFGAEGAERYAEAQTRWSIYDVVGEAAFQSPAEAQATLNKLRPTSQEGAAAQGESYEAAARMYNEQRRQLEADPVAVLAQRDPTIRAARETVIGAANTPEAADTIAVYFNTLRARQQVLGIAEPKLLPEAQRIEIAGGLQFDPNAPLKRVQMLATLRQSYGGEFAAVMQEVAPKLDGIARVLINMTPKDAERLDAAFAQRETYKTAVPEKARGDIKKALQLELAQFSATLADYPDAEARYAEHVEGAELLAQSLVFRGTSPLDAARQAAGAVVNSQFKFRGDLRIPSELDDGRIVAALDRTKADLVKAGKFLIKENEWSTPERAQEDMRNVIGRAGYWITSSDGTGAVLRFPHRGGLGDVFRPDGSRVEVSFARLMELDLSGAPLNVELSSGY